MLRKKQILSAILIHAGKANVSDSIFLSRKPRVTNVAIPVTLLLIIQELKLSFLYIKLNVPYFKLFFFDCFLLVVSLLRSKHMGHRVPKSFKKSKSNVNHWVSSGGLLGVVGTANLYGTALYSVAVNQ